MQPAAATTCRGAAIYEPRQLVRRPHLSLTNDDSKALRDRLLGELLWEALASSDELTSWAYRILPFPESDDNSRCPRGRGGFYPCVDSGVDATDPSNALGGMANEINAGIAAWASSAMRRQVGGACTEPVWAQRRLITSRPQTSSPKRCQRRPLSVGSHAQQTCAAVDREHLEIRWHPTLPRLRPSAVRCASPSPAQQTAMGRKVSDEYTVPLCRHHHRELHRRGDERIWWRQLNIDPRPAAEQLWQQTQIKMQSIDTRPSPDAGE